MPGSGLLLLLDDITSVLDDVASLTKVTAQKTAGVLGDDLALNAQQVSGVNADRELPVVWAVAKGSALNKAILVPLALLISTFAAWAVAPLLMLGGGFLCFEGVEKVVHTWFGHHDPKPPEPSSAPTVGDAGGEPVAQEGEKIKGAIRTDFVLSAEIVVIALGVVAAEPLSTKVAVLVAIAVAMTVGVYGLVAGIVKLDDLGLHLARSGSASLAPLGRAILAFAPYLMKALSVGGTLAMFLVGGGIVSHGIPALHHLVQDAVPSDGVLSHVVPTLANLLVGVLVGACVLGLVALFKRARR